MYESEDNEGEVELDALDHRFQALVDGNTAIMGDSFGVFASHLDPSINCSRKSSVSPTDAPGSSSIMRVCHPVQYCRLAFKANVTMRRSSVMYAIPLW